MTCNLTIFCLADAIMKTMGISKFKSHSSQILDQVAETQETTVITKRGKPLAQITPYRTPDLNSTPVKLADSLGFEKDIISPFGDEMREKFANEIFA